MTGHVRGLALLLIAVAGPDVVVAEITFQFRPDDEAVLGKFTIDSGRNSRCFVPYGAIPTW